MRTRFMGLRWRQAQRSEGRVQNYRRFAKHGSMACILINDKVIEFALIHWDEDLSKQPPVFVVQIDTALFAYEPVLEAIEDIKDLPLRADFLG